MYAIRSYYDLDTAFSAHTYSHTTIGYFRDILDMPGQFAYSRQFFDRYYRPGYATIIVVGDARPQQVVITSYSRHYTKLYESQTGLQPAECIL